MVRFTITRREKDFYYERAVARTGTLNANWFLCFPPGTLLCLGARGRLAKNQIMVVAWTYTLRSFKEWWFCFRYKVQVHERIAWE